MVKLDNFSFSLEEKPILVADPIHNYKLYIELRANLIELRANLVADTTTCLSLYLGNTKNVFSYFFFRERTL